MWVTTGGEAHLKRSPSPAGRGGHTGSMMGNALPKEVADFLDSPAGRAVLEGGAIWFRWNHQAKTIESSGRVLLSTPEQMSRPQTTVFLRVGEGGWKRYA